MPSVRPSVLQLLHPLGADSPILGFLKKNPDGGIHHICIEVDDIRAAVTDLTAGGIRALNKEPKIGAHGKPVVFLHPKVTRACRCRGNGPTTVLAGARGLVGCSLALTGVGVAPSLSPPLLPAHSCAPGRVPALAPARPLVQDCGGILLELEEA